MADGRHRIARVEQLADEADGVLVQPKRVGVPDAAREDEPVVVVGAGVLDGAVDAERVGLVVVVEALDLALLERDELRRPAGRLDRLPRLVSSTCSNMSVARNAILRPFSSSAMEPSSVGSVVAFLPWRAS